MANEFLSPGVNVRRLGNYLAAALFFVILVGLASVVANSSATGKSEVPISAPPSLLRHSFAIFRTSPEQLPPEEAAALSGEFSDIPQYRGQGFNLALTQKAVLPGVQAPLWVVPGRKDLLLIDEVGGHYTAMSTISQAVSRGLGIWAGVPRTANPHVMRVVGVAPDDVSAVKVSRGVAAIVRNNAFTATLRVGQGLGGPWENRNWIFLRGVPTAS